MKKSSKKKGLLGIFRRKRKFKSKLKKPDPTPMFLVPLTMDILREIEYEDAVKQERLEWERAEAERERAEKEAAESSPA